MATVFVKTVLKGLVGALVFLYILGPACATDESDYDDLSMTQSIIFTSLPKNNLKPQASPHWPLMHDRLVLTLEPIASDIFHKFFPVVEQLKHHFKTYMINDQPSDTFLRYVSLLNTFHALKNLDVFGIDLKRTPPLVGEFVHQTFLMEKTFNTLGAQINSEVFFKHIQNAMRDISGKGLDAQFFGVIKKTLELTARSVVESKPSMDPLKTLTLEEFIRGEINGIYGSNVHSTLVLWMAEEFNFYLIPAIKARRAFLLPDEFPSPSLDLPDDLFAFRKIPLSASRLSFEWEDVALRTSRVLVDKLNDSEVDSSTRERMKCLLRFLEKVQKKEDGTLDALRLLTDYLIYMQFYYGLTHDLLGQPLVLEIQCTKDGHRLHEVMAFEADRLGKKLSLMHDDFLNKNDLQTWFFLNGKLLEP